MAKDTRQTMTIDAGGPVIDNQNLVQLRPRSPCGFRRLPSFEKMAHFTHGPKARGECQGPWAHQPTIAKNEIFKFPFARNLSKRRSWRAMKIIRRFGCHCRIRSPNARSCSRDCANSRKTEEQLLFHVH
jgi:hypothetical protein